jgi:restriction system protein
MRHRSFVTTMRVVAREAARAERARAQAHTRHQAAQRQAIRDANSRSKADAKEALRLHVAGQIEEAEALTQELRDRDRVIESLLLNALSKQPAIDLTATIEEFSPGAFDDRQWSRSEPEFDSFVPKPSGFLSRLIPGHEKRHARKTELAETQFASAHETYMASRRADDRALQAFQDRETERKSAYDAENEKVLSFQRSLAAAEHAAVLRYFKLVLDRSIRGEPDAISAEIGYSKDSKHLVVDLELPEFSVIPEEIGFKYIKTNDRIDPVVRPLAKRKLLYSNLISQITLKCVDTIFRSDTAGVVECLTLNGMLDTIDPATGQQVRVCLLSVRVGADTFQGLNLHQVQPEHCLRSLKASVSRAPTELLPVKPIVELDMVDPRFVETMDVMSGLDHRPNLMDLNPTEFEGLITNLFATMGLDTRQTRPSRDGGVDCVAFDPRPVFGGKVVIQAKRYKNTVGVSAVRDLFGTVQNEGASKGILVTTSGYGKAAFEFARGKPLELLDGGNLLHLLSEHAGIDARIIMPDGWVDLPLHGE